MPLLLVFFVVLSMLAIVKADRKWKLLNLAAIFAWIGLGILLGYLLAYDGNMDTAGVVAFEAALATGSIGAADCLRRNSSTHARTIEVEGLTSAIIPTTV